MYHIVKSKDQFMVVLVGRNGEALSTSERFTTKAKAWGNVRAQLRIHQAIFSWAFVQDDTIDTPLLYQAFDNGERKLFNEFKPLPKYQPGKNSWKR